MRVLVAMEVGRQVQAPPNQLPVDGWGLEIPVGSRIVRVGFAADAGGKATMHTLVLVSPNAPKVWHPLLILPVGGHYAPLLGRSIGECFGVAQLGPQAFGVFADAPWPTSTVEAIKGGAA